MLLIVLLVLGIVGVCRLPGILKTQPMSFPGATPELFNEWRKKELASIYVTLASGWGLLALSFLVGVFVGAAGIVRTEEDLKTFTLIVNGVGLLILIAGCVWASSLGTKAKKLKQAMMSAPTGGFYPRYGVDAAHATAMPPLEDSEKLAP